MVPRFPLRPQSLPTFRPFRSWLLVAALLNCLALACSSSAERCVVDGVSVADQVTRAGMPCQICDLAKSQNEWSLVPNGEGCGDGLACFEGECLPQCRDGELVVDPGEHHPEAWCRVCGSVEGRPALVNLEMGTACGETRHCIMGHCVDSCLIDDGFWDVEGRNPANPCFQCIPERSTSEWVKGADGLYVCKKPGEFCLDGDCTPGCFIDGEVIALGSPHPTEPCLHCPERGARFWTPRSERSPCGDGGQMECRKGECLPKSLDLEMQAILAAGELVAVGFGGDNLRVSDKAGVWQLVGDDGWEPELVEGSGKFIALGHWPSRFSQALALDEEGGLWSDHGVKWSPRDLSLPGARAFWGQEDEQGWQLFFVGDGGSAWSWREQGEPVAMDVPVSADLKAVFGHSASDVWAVGDAGTVLHFDGDTWIRIETGHQTELRAIWAAELPEGNSEGSNLEDGSSESKNSESSRRVVAVGKGGVVLRSEDGGQSWISDIPEEAEDSDILGLVETGGELYAVGSKGLFVASSDFGKTWRPQATGLERRDSVTLNALWLGVQPRLLSSEEPAPVLVVAVGGDSQGGLVLLGR